jgi:hypothetical protein
MRVALRPLSCIPKTSASVSPATAGGLPRRTPRARAAASASLVLWLIKRPSSCAKTAVTACIASPWRRTGLLRIEGDEAPSLRVGLIEETGIGGQGPRQPVQLGNKQHSTTRGRKGTKRSIEAGTIGLACADTGVLENLFQVPVPTPASRLDRRPLRLQPEPSGRLLSRRDANVPVGDHDWPRRCCRNGRLCNTKSLCRARDMESR